MKTRFWNLHKSAQSSYESQFTKLDIRVCLDYEISHRPLRYFENANNYLHLDARHRQRETERM
ncbi:hypothetical protein TSUD_112170 [Trifolium subterraneum]|uniref:Uncharacterized protein n=1 Tax=Trifolium subterraneum TaxID=3900 RepID=A0A2Z6PHT0_TRISU|nr:hypothetical protein TSUD_112170 [Trifolium subterraneum]